MNNYIKLFTTVRKTDLLNHDEKEELHLYLMNLRDQVKKQREIIDKANSKMESMFANGDNEKILDDLLELSNILEDKEVGE